MNTRILTTPVRLTGSVHPQQLANLVAIDAMVRRRAELGQPPVNWPLTTVIGDAAVQRAVQRAVAREGDDREQLGREGFAARARQLEREAAADLRRLLNELGVQADLDSCTPDGEIVSRVARVAFVRLYDAGVLSLSEVVLDSCPSCETVVDDVDADAAEIDVDQIRVRLELSDGSLEIDTAEPELWVGAVAVAIPADVATVDEAIELPLLEGPVPLIGIDGLSSPVVVVPGHDRWSYELARQAGFPIVEVLDGEGIVRQPSSLEGLGRFAARSAAIEQLTASGHLIAHFAAKQTVKRCYRCATVLVPLFGRHWILDMRELVDPVVEAIKSGVVGFNPPSAEEHLLEVAERTGSWCVSQQLWSGQRIPVATCLDCGRTRVSVEEDLSCGSCMGTLEPHTDVLDARFIAALTPLAVIGWPMDPEKPGDVATTLSVGPVGLDTWALPMAALGLRLGGAIPFSYVILHHAPIGAVEAGRRPTAEMIQLVQSSGRSAVRAALLAGDLDLDRATEALQLLDSPVSSENTMADLVEPYDKALNILDAGGALALLVGAAKEGMSSDDSIQLRVLSTPLLGG